MFSERSLRVQWRLLQVVLGFPAALFLVGFVLVAILDPAGAWTMLSQPRFVLTWLAVTGAVYAIDRHLQPR